MSKEPTKKGRGAPNTDRPELSSYPTRNSQKQIMSVSKTEHESNLIRSNRRRRFALSNLFRSILPTGTVMQWLALQAGAVTPDDGKPLTTLACPSCGETNCSFVGAGIATADHERETTISMTDSDSRGHRVGKFMLDVRQGGEDLCYPQGRPAVFSIAECDHCRSTFAYQIAHEYGRLALRASLCVDLSVPDADDPIPASRREVSL